MRNVHDDFESISTQIPNLRAANEHLHRRIAELEAERNALQDRIFLLKSRVHNVLEDVA